MSLGLERPLIIGASGQVGGALVEQLGTACLKTTRQPSSAGVQTFALEDAARDPMCAHKLLDHNRAGVVFIAAGMSHVDRCEVEPEATFALNRDAPAAIARAAHAQGAKTVYFSTEYVFDGEDGPYNEDDTPHPLSVYGRSKLDGEEAVRKADPEALIIRTTVVYGPESQGRNFAYQLASRLVAGERMNVPHDQVSSPTYNRDLATAAIELVAAGTTGVFNIAGPEILGRVEFAIRLATAAALNLGSIRPVSTSDLSQKARRPLQAGLQTSKLRRILPDVSLRDVDAVVRDWREHPRGKSWPK